MFFSFLCKKSKIEELRVHKVVPVMLHTFYLLLSGSDLKRSSSNCNLGNLYCKLPMCLGSFQKYKTEWKGRPKGGGLNYIISSVFKYINRNIKLRNSKKICNIAQSDAHKKSDCQDLEDKFDFWKNLFSLILSNCREVQYLWFQLTMQNKSNSYLTVHEWTPFRLCKDCIFKRFLRSYLRQYNFIFFLQYLYP